MDMNVMPWFGWIVIAGIVSYTLVEIVSTLLGRRKKESAALSESLRANTEAQASVAARLEGIENRLATSEKTLTDIP